MLRCEVHLLCDFIWGIFPKNAKKKIIIRVQTFIDVNFPLILMQDILNLLIYFENILQNIVYRAFAIKLKFYFEIESRKKLEDKEKLKSCSLKCIFIIYHKKL